MDGEGRGKKGWRPAHDTMQEGSFDYLDEERPLVEGRTGREAVGIKRLRFQECKRMSQERSAGQV